MIIREVNSLASKPALRIWLDIGTQEATHPVKQLRDALKAKGWALNSDLVYFEAEGAKHNDEAFGRRASRLIKYVFPAQSSSK